jgi:hypothetical protein
MKTKNYQQLNCLIPQADYNLFKSVVFLKGRKINDALTEAIALWLEEEKRKLTSNLKQKEKE